MKVNSSRASLSKPIDSNSNGPEEGTDVGYPTIYRDLQTGQYRLWYSVHEDGLVRLAVSQDGLTWQRRALALPKEFQIRSDNQQVTPAGKETQTDITSVNRTDSHGQTASLQTG